MTKISKISILGAGNLGQAIANGLARSQNFQQTAVSLTRRKLPKQDQKTNTNHTWSTDNRNAVQDADMVIAAVQPQQMATLFQEIQESLKPNTIVISVATGITLEKLQTWTKEKLPLFRCMPNTAIAAGESMTCISYTDANADQINTVQALFATLGETMIIDEKLMQAATVLAASGIAFWMRFIRAMTQGGIQLGFEANEAQVIATQTCLGAASLLKERSSHPESEIDRVTTPRGCTISGLNEMEHHGLSSALIRGVLKSYDKINQIKEESNK